MRAVMVAEPGAVSIETVPDPTPGRDEVVIAVRGCGICGTDLHILEHGLPTARYPLIPGHEPWGEVVDVGADVRDARVGDLVAVDPSLHCGRCARCRRGQGNLCERWGAIGATRAGAWADYTAAPGANCYVLPPDYPLDCASIIEPIACAVRGMERLRPRADRSALIYGGGTMGILLAILLDINGVGPITIVELSPARRDIACGVTPAEVIAPEELAARDTLMDYVIDATGAAGAISDALAHVAGGGTMMVFGVASPEARVPLAPFEVYQREITIVGSMAILHSFAPAVETVRRHAGRFRPLLTHRYGLDQFDAALKTLAGGSAIKVTIAPGV